MRAPAFAFAGLLALLAAGLQLGVSRPARSEATALGSERERLAGELESLQRRLTALERDEQARQRALSRLGGLEASAREPVTSVRRALLSSLERVPADAVQISVSPARGAAAAEVAVRASVSLEGLVELSEALVRPGAGLALRSARISAAAPGLNVELEGSSVREGRP